jgi:hypothetical protein
MDFSLKAFRRRPRCSPHLLDGTSFGTHSA